MEKKIFKIFEEYLTIDECAEILKCHPNTIRNLIENNELISIKLGGMRGFRISIDAFEELIIKKKYIPQITKTENLINLNVK